jgi:two-component system phosphate regulon response regulator PhoB
MSKSDSVNAPRILLVEDDKELREMYKQRLEMENFKVYEADDGAEGINKIDRIEPDVIVLDLVMPNVTGIEFLELVKGLPETAEIPVIVLTAYPAKKPEIDHIQIEAFLVKSEISIEDLVKKIKEILER